MIRNISGMILPAGIPKQGCVNLVESEVEIIKDKLARGIEVKK